MLGYAHSPRVLAHDPPPSTPQIAGRAFPLGSANVAQAVLTARAHDLVERSALSGSLARIALAPAPDEALLAVHTAAYLGRLRDAGAGGPWDGEHAPVTAATWAAARLTVGGVLAAVDAVLDGRVRRALVRARPAGHHAEPDRAIASTYLNNVACGAEHARARGAERVAIVDWDVHVGNGAESVFWDRDDILAISLHQQSWYPAHAGALHATGGPKAPGCTVSTEGGYSLIYNPFCLLGVLEGLAGESGGIPDPWRDDATVLATQAPADGRVRAAVAAVRGAPAALVHLTLALRVRTYRSTPAAGRERVLAAGQVVAFPVGPTGTHQVLNWSSPPARVLICATNRLPEVVEQVEDQQLAIITAAGLRLAPAGTPAMGE